MVEEYVTYLGRKVPKKGFRVYIYRLNNEEKLVESYDEYQMYLDTGEWYPTKGAISSPALAPVLEPAPVPMPVSVRAPAVKKTADKSKK